MSTSELQKLAEQIYQKHRKALDIIFEYRPDQQSEIQNIQLSLIEKNKQQLILEHSTKGYVRFSLQEFEQFTQLKKGNGWTSSGRILLFEFRNRPDSINLSLIIGPGDQGVRENIYNHTSKEPTLFNLTKRALTGSWSAIYKKTILTKKDFEESDLISLQEKIETNFKTFMESDREKIIKSITKIGLS